MTTRKRKTEQIASSPDMKITPLMYNERQTSERTGLSISFLQKGRSTGALPNRTPPPPHVKINGSVFYRDSDLRKWVAELPTTRQG